MFWKRKESVQIEEINKKLESSFSKVYEDNQKLIKWVSFLKQKADSQDQRITELEAKSKGHQVEALLATVHKINAKLNHLFDNHYGHQTSTSNNLEVLNKDLTSLKIDQSSKYSELKTRIEALTQKLESIKVQPQMVIETPKVQEVPLLTQAPKVQSHPVSQETVKRRTLVQEKIMRNINRNSKDYIKNYILNYIIKYQKISALQLRDILVEEQGLCSKSSFYRFLEELEKDDNVSVISDGKQKIFLSNIKKTN